MGESYLASPKDFPEIQAEACALSKAPSLETFALWVSILVLSSGNLALAVTGFALLLRNSVLGLKRLALELESLAVLLESHVVALDYLLLPLASRFLPLEHLALPLRTLILSLSLGILAPPLAPFPFGMSRWKALGKTRCFRIAFQQIVSFGKVYV
jgi:hypothetical protein